MRLSSLSSAALAAALVAAAAVLAFSAFPALFVWAAFIGWASYDHSGAGMQAAVRSSAALVFGVVMAWLVAITVVAHLLPASEAVSTAIVAGTASFLIVMASRTALLSVVPATFYGFASTFAYLSLASGAFTIENLTSLSWRNAESAFRCPYSSARVSALSTAGWQISLRFATPAAGTQTTHWRAHEERSRRQFLKVRAGCSGRGPGWFWPKSGHAVSVLHSLPGLPARCSRHVLTEPPLT